MATDETPGYPEHPTEQPARRVAPEVAQPAPEVAQPAPEVAQPAPEVAQRPPSQSQQYASFACPTCHQPCRMSLGTAEVVRASGRRGVHVRCPKCRTEFLLVMRGGDLTAVLTPEAEGQVGDVTDTKDQPRVGKLRTPANGDVADAPTQRRVTEGSAGGLGRDVEEFIRSELQRLEDNLQTGLGHLGALQQQLGAVPDGVSEHVRQHVGVLARRIEELQRSVGEITDNLYQFVADFQGPIAEKLDAASEAVAAVLQKFDAHTQQSAMQHNSLGKRLSGLGVNLEELNKITSRLHAAFDPVVELQKRRLDEMNEARNKELRQLNDARDEELKHSNRERHDELMKMHDELFKTNEAIKATHAAGMEELRGEFAELRSSYDAFRESLLANTAKLDEFSNRHLSDEVLARLAAHVLQVVANPQRLRALFYESLALPSRQTPEDIRPKS